MLRHPPNNIREFEACTHFVPRKGCEIGVRIAKVCTSIKFTAIKQGTCLYSFFSQLFEIQTKHSGRPDTMIELG